MRWLRRLKGQGFEFFVRWVGDTEVALLFEPRDMWRGLYWDIDDGWLSVYLCPVWMVPIRLSRKLGDR